LNQIFDVFIREFSGYAVGLHGKPGNSDRQRELLLVFLASCAPRLPLVANLDAFLADFSDSRDKVEFLDLVDHLSDEEQMLSSAYTYDGLHLNSAAYEIWVKEINRVLDAESE
jgi:hypothetical protein